MNKKEANILVSKIIKHDCDINSFINDIKTGSDNLKAATGKMANTIQVGKHKIKLDNDWESVLRNCYQAISYSL